MSTRPPRSLKLTHAVAAGVVVAASATVGTWFAAARAFGIPDSLAAPALVYSGVLLKNGLPVTTETEIEVGLWDDQVRGNPDFLLCSTGEGVLVVPDATGAFTIALPDQPGVQDRDCIGGLASSEGTAFVQVEVDRDVVRYQQNGATVERLPLSAVPFAVESLNAVNALNAQTAAAAESALFPTESADPQSIDGRLDGAEATLADILDRLQILEENNPP